MTIDIQRNRADFFRDQLASRYECPDVDDYPCKGKPCPYDRDDDGTDYAACWDEVERRQR